MLLYGVAGPKASVHAYAQAKGDTSQTPCWRLSAGIEARASLDLSAISIFGFGLKDYATEPYGKDFTIAEGACDPASQGLNPNAEAFAFTLADPSPSSLSATAVLALPDGSWVVAGRGSSALHLYRVRPDGTLAWQKGFSDTFGVAGLALAADGCILLGGDHVRSPWMAKVDLDGKLLWSKTYGPNVSDVRSFVRSPTGISLTTAYDEYALRAFKLNSIDYLLKPIDEDDLEVAVDKYKKLIAPKPAIDMQMIRQFLTSSQAPEFKKRFSVKVGDHIKIIPIEDVELFYSEFKGTFIHTFEGRSFLLDTTLESLEKELEPKQFFGVSRKYIISHSALKDIVIYSNSRLKLTLKSYTKEEVIVSRACGRF